MTTHAITADKGLQWKRKTRSRLEICWTKAVLVGKGNESKSVPQVKEQVKLDKIETHWETQCTIKKLF